MEQATVSHEQARKNFLAKYDLNHNGVLDTEEKENALDDPAYIESELDVIDANHNGRIDPEELAYFDANENKILEPEEQVGIEIAQHLFAARLLKQFDANGNGFLDRNEFIEMFTQASFVGNVYQAAGAIRDGQCDVEQLTSLLTQQLRISLSPRRRPGQPFFGLYLTAPISPGDPRQSFKAAVEAYWQNPDSVSSGPPK